MELGIVFGAYEPFGDAAWETMRAHGYTHGDYGLANTEAEIFTCSEAEFEARLLGEKAAAQKAGVAIHQVHGPWRWPIRDSTEEDRAERMASMKKSIRGAAILGSPYWVIHPIMPFGVLDLGTEDEARTWQLNLEFMGELLKTAKEYGVTICFENMPFLKFSISTPEAIKRFVEEMNDENFQICLDTGHVSVFPELSLGDSVRSLGSHIKVLHVHDNDREHDRHFMPYFGKIDWAEFKAALRDIGYSGVLSLEASPPKTLPTALYEKSLLLLSDIAKELAE